MCGCLSPSSHGEPLTVRLQPTLAKADGFLGNYDRVQLFCRAGACSERGTWPELHAVNVTSCCVETELAWRVHPPSGCAHSHRGLQTRDVEVCLSMSTFLRKLAALHCLAQCRS